MQQPSLQEPFDWGIITQVQVSQLMREQQGTNCLTVVVLQVVLGG